MTRTICLALAASALAAGCGERASSAAPQPRPNIIFVLADDMGYGDLGCYGGKGARTANIDRLASEGIRFTQFYVGAPICSPSRTAFTTGQYPARWGITSYIDNRAANRRRGMAQWLDVKAPTLARSLSQAGYATGHFGKWHMGGGRDVGEAPLPTEYGFDESLTQFEGLGDRVLPVLTNETQDGAPQKMGLGLASEKLGRGAVRWEDRSKVTSAFVQQALGFIKKSQAAGKPFYVNLWPDDVHSPFDPPRTLRGDGSKKALYHGVLTSMDEQLGPLFEAVRRDPKLRDNTLILFASDNGPEPGAGSAGSFRGAKGSLYEGGIREPLIAWGPGLIAQAQRGKPNTTAVLSAVDFLPSLLNLAGVRQAPAGSDGQDVSAALTGKKATGRTQPLLWRRPPDRGGSPGAALPDLAIRDGQWKLLAAEDGSNAELYDLSSDVGEQRNVAAQHGDIARRLTELVLRWNKGLPPAPKPARANQQSRFALKSGAHLDRDEAPQLPGKALSIRASFGSRAADGAAASGVLVAQGGVAQGYTLFVEGGQLTFLVRQERQAFTVSVPLAATGTRTATATLARGGALTLALDGQEPARGKASGLFTQQPLDGLDVGSDQEGPVGDYTDANRFTGEIQDVTIELSDAK